MAMTNLLSAPEVPFNIDGRIMFSGARTEVIHLRLQPGEKLGQHDNPADVIFYMLQGSAFLTCEGTETELTSDTCIGLNKGVLRAWHNRSEQEARILVIKEL